MRCYDRPSHMRICFDDFKNNTLHAFSSRIFRISSSLLHPIYLTSSLRKRSMLHSIICLSTLEINSKALLFDMYVVLFFKRFVYTKIASRKTFCRRFFYCTKMYINCEIKFNFKLLNKYDLEQVPCSSKFQSENYSDGFFPICVTLRFLCM